MASRYGRVVVLVNNDEWLIRKKGKAFMQQDERLLIMKSFQDVHWAEIIPGKKDSACEGIKRVVKSFSQGGQQYTQGTNPIFLFGNGGDRVSLNTPEIDTCVKLGVGLVWGLGAKIQSSSDLIANAGV